jgi:hypothetical protein
LVASDAAEAIMAAKDISVKKYVVRLSGEEREQLEALIRKGKSAAQRLLKARILLKADVSEAGEGWSDNRIIKALACSKPPKGRARWTLRLLEKKVVELQIVDRASDSTIGRALKKTFSSPIASSAGSSRRRPMARS